MNIGIILRLVMVIGGIFLLIVSVLSLARRKMTESLCVAWGLFAVLLVLGGILLRPTRLGDYMSAKGVILVILVGVLAVAAAYGVCRMLATLVRQNRELMMEVALLNEEVQRLEERQDGCDAYDGGRGTVRRESTAEPRANDGSDAAKQGSAAAGGGA